MGSFRLQKETRRSRGGIFFPFEMSGRMYGKKVKEARALPGGRQTGGVVDDRLEAGLIFRGTPQAGQNGKVQQHLGWNNPMWQHKLRQLFIRGVWVVLDSTSVSLSPQTRKL